MSFRITYRSAQTTICHVIAAIGRFVELIL